MITVNVRGTAEVERTLAKIAPKHAEALVKQTVSAIATDIVKEAKRGMNFTGPYSTGRMKRSVKKRQRRTRRGIVQTDINVSKRAFYWRFYEYGDANVRRRGMFAKAINKTRPILGVRFQELFMKKLIARLAKERRANLKKVR
jgi:HK97 gp10 family phage protein